MRTLNLGILAHVDAGKTSLTERLLYAAGAIDAVGRVDHGTTQTDTLALERERGITIKTAVASFAIGDVTVNLIDTPGHPDFIAEVDRVLGLLDGAVLVVSAVEGVQAQTRILMRALQRQRIPTLIFVNKIDRMGADATRAFAAVAANLSPSTIAMQRIDGIGTHEATVISRSSAGEVSEVNEVNEELLTLLAEHDGDLLAKYVAGVRISPRARHRRLRSLTRQAATHPVLFGSAMTGAGIGELMRALLAYLPTAAPTMTHPTSGVVFKIDRASTGERTAVVRMFSGCLSARDHVVVDGRSRQITRLAVFEPGGAVGRERVVAGQIAKVAGLGLVTIGDTIGGSDVARVSSMRNFSPPPFEAVVSPVADRDRGALRVALDALAAEDPLINVRQDDGRGELSVSLYGDVQRDVIHDTLRREFGIETVFSATTVVCIERVVGVGESIDPMPNGRSPRHPFLAGVGLRVEPAPLGSGVTVSTGIETGRLPMAFIHAIDETVRVAMRQGPHGWDIPDCSVTMIASGYWPRQSRAHGTFDKNMSSTATDFRLLTPLVLVDALRRAGTAVHEQVLRFHLEAPLDALGPIARLLASIHAIPESPVPVHEVRGSAAFTLDGLIPAARLAELRRQIPTLTGGEGFVETVFDSYWPVRGEAPRRPRTDLNPLDRTNYLRQIAHPT